MRRPPRRRAELALTFIEATVAVVAIQQLRAREELAPKLAGLDALQRKFNRFFAPPRRRR